MDLSPRGAVSDEEIVRRIQRGEQELFGRLFDRHYGRLERFVRHLGVPESELEDTLAEVFSRALTRIQAFRADDGARYVSYLYAIARNLMADRARRLARSPRLESWSDAETDADVDGQVSPVDQVLHREQVDAIRAAIRRLNPADREIILLSYDRELSCREIMAIMGKPSISAVTTHLYKAMQKLRAAVRAADDEEAPRVLRGNP